MIRSIAGVEDMRTPSRKWGLGMVSLLSLVGLVMGCAQYKPFEYHPISEIPEGPGLFSGAKGEWSIARNGKFLPQADAATVPGVPGPSATGPSATVPVNTAPPTNPTGPAQTNSPPM